MDIVWFIAGFLTAYAVSAIGLVILLWRGCAAVEQIHAGDVTEAEPRVLREAEEAAARQWTKMREGDDRANGGLA